MAQSSKHGSVGPIHPEIQGPQVPVGPAGRSFRQLQGRQVPGYCPQKTLRTRRVLLQTVPGRCHPLIRTRLQRNPCAGQRREVHSAARLPLNVPPTLYHGLQNRCEDLPRRGTGQSQGEAQASERYVQQDDQCGPRRPHRGRAQAQRCHETKVHGLARDDIIYGNAWFPARGYQERRRDILQGFQNNQDQVTSGRSLQTLHLIQPRHCETVFGPTSSHQRCPQGVSILQESRVDWELSVICPRLKKKRRFG